MFGIPLVTGASSAWAGNILPTSGHYVAGTGAIAKRGSSGLSINQSSATGIIDWSSFSIGKGNSVQFNNGVGATLNRVTGGNLSTIAGSLKATGSLYLINPQGVIVSGSGKVVTGGSFVASSRDESDVDFLGGKRKFSGASNGKVSNVGTIKSANGDVALIGSSVSNSGSMSAANGTASLNAGNQVLLAPAGSRILVSGGTGSASNSGTLAAAQAQINAAGGNVYALAGNNGGIVRATGTKSVNGHVWLTSGSGNLTVAGNVTATNADGSGGAVTTRANNIVISGNIDASATKGTKSGGNVSIIAQDTTQFAGTIAAKGGDHGKGGLVETSGQHLKVADSAKVTTLAKDGLSGDWLIDPNDFTIAASGGDITGAQLSTNLGTTDVTIASGDGANAGNGDIFVNDDVTWASSHKLTLNAQRNITVNANMTVAGQGSVALNTGLGGSGDLLFTLGSGRLAFTNITNGNLTALFINGQNYRLETSLDNLVADYGGTNLHMALADNIDASNEGVYSSSVIQTAFQGTLEGLGNTISNITISHTTTSSDNVGFFSYVNFQGAVKDLLLTDMDIDVQVSAGSASVGGLIGQMSNGTVFNVMVDGVIQLASSSSHGGVVGGLTGTVLNNATIQSSLADVDITVAGQTTGGGFVGSANGAVIKNSAALGDVSMPVGGNTGIGLGGFVGDNSATLENDYASGAVLLGSGLNGYAGGFVGIQRAAGTTNNSYATGAVDITNNVNGVEVAGGFVGSNLGTIGNSYASGDVTGGLFSGIGGFGGKNSGRIANSVATGSVTGGNGSTGGGLVASNSGNITNSTATGNVSVGFDGKAGGFAGSNGGNITSSSATGSVTGDTGRSFVGGFVGVNTGTIQAADATGSVIGGDGFGASFAPAGGFAGENDGTIRQAYATGSVSAGDLADIGGFVGLNNASGVIDEAYETGAGILQSDSVVGSFAGANSGSLGASTAVYFAAGAVLDVGSGDSILQGGALSRADMEDYHDFDGWTFGTTPGASGWVIIDTDGSLNNDSGSGATTPMLLGEYSTVIASAHQLQLMELDPSAAYTLVVDVDASGTGSFGDVWSGDAFVPVGGNGNPSSFTGTFDGGNHEISNLTIVSESGSVGMFGDAAGVIKDVGLVTLNITGGVSVGGLAGRVEGAQISGVFVTGNILGLSGDVGGLVGELGSGASISGSWSEIVLGGIANNAGGIAGVIDSGSSISWSHADGSVQAMGLAGGIAGQNDGAISFSYSAGAGVNSFTDYAGGIAGANTGTISDVYASQDVSAFSSVAGGLVGNNTGDVENSFWNTDAVFAGPISSFGADSGTSWNVAGLLRADMGKTSSFSGWTFGALGSGANWVLIGADGSVNNPYEVEGGTLPMLLNEYSTTITNAHQLQLMTLDLTQDYVLGNDIDASGTAGGVWGSDGFIAVGGNNFLDTPFSGTFDGAGHTIDRLGLVDNANAYVGLFGTLSADVAVSNVSLTNLGIIHTSAGALPNNVGGIAGSSAGSISHVSVSGSITVDGIASVGGVAGFNSGDIVNAQTSFEIEVQNDADQGQGVGGVVGFNAGNVQSSSAAGDINANGGVSAGGLVGFNSADASDPAYVISSSATANVTVGSDAAAGGLVGTNNNFSWIENSYATGDVDGSALYAGGLIGLNDSAWTTSSYATGDVTSFGDLAEVGGFVGLNHNSVIRQSFATGNANAVLAGGIAGGFAGENTGSITDSYAMGNASADTAGGFVGQNDGAITTSYSLGIASGTTVGGFAGVNNGTTTHSFWDTDTSGVLVDNPTGTGNQATGETTVQAQQGLATGFDNSIWGIGWGRTFAFLKWQFSDSDDPTAISGMVYSGSEGTSAGSGVAVSLSDRTAYFGTVTTYADGSFYKLVANLPDTIVLASTGSGTTLSDAGNAAVDYTGMAIYDSVGLTIQTADQNLSTLAANIDAATGLGTDFQTIQNVLSGSGNRDLILEVSGNGFQIDQALDIGTGTLTLKAHEYVYETGDGFIAADTLNGTADDGMVLNGANRIANLGSFTGTFGFQLTDAQSLAVGDVNVRRTVGSTSSDESALMLSTTGNGSVIGISGQVSADIVVLNSAAQITEAGGEIAATTLRGSSVGNVTLNGANTVANLDTFSTGGSHTFSMNDYTGLTVTGAVNAGNGVLAIGTLGSGHGIALNNTLSGGNVLLISAATLSESAGPGKIVATSFSGSSVGATTLNGMNAVASLGAFSTGGSYTFSMNDCTDLAVTGAVNTGKGVLAIGTVGTGHDITINNTLTGGNVLLISAATLTENASTGKIATTSFSGSSVSTASLNGLNTIASLGAFSTGGNHTFSMNDYTDLAVTGAVNTGKGVLAIGTVGTGHDITINNTLTGGNVLLISAATLTENVSTGKIATTSFSGSSTGATSLNGKNTIANLGAFSTGGNHTFSMNDYIDLAVTGVVNTAKGVLAIGTGDAGNIAINNMLTGGTVMLISAGTLVENTAGKIAATTLTGSSVRDAILNNANTIATLGSFTSSGSFTLTDAKALTVAGPLTASASNATVALTTTVGNLSFTGTVNGAIVTLNTAGEATQTGASAITTNLINVTAKTGINLVGANHIQAVGTRSTTSGPNVINGIGM